MEAVNVDRGGQQERFKDMEATQVQVVSQGMVESIERAEVAMDAREEEGMEACRKKEEVRGQEQERQEQERQEHERKEHEKRESAQREGETENESIKKVVEECLARSHDSAQELEIKLLEAQERIKYLEENVVNCKKESAWMVVEIMKVQDLKIEMETKENSMTVYRKVIVLMGAEIKRLTERKGSKAEDGKLDAAEIKLKTVEKEMEDLVNKLNIVTGEKEYAEKSANNMESVLKTIIKAEEAIKLKAKRKTKCRDFNKPQGCSRGALCWFVHQDEIHEGGMVVKGDCSFWLEGRCKFPDQDCRNYHDPSKKGSKSRGLKEISQAVFGGGQDWSPPPGMVIQVRPAHGLEDENGCQTGMTQQVRPVQIMEDENNWQTGLINQDMPTQGLQDENGWQSGMVKQVRSAQGLEDKNGRQSGMVKLVRPAQGMEDENGWQTVLSKEARKKTKGAARGMGERESSAPQPEGQASQVASAGTTTQTFPVTGRLDQQGLHSVQGLEYQEWKADSKKRGFKRGGRRLAKVQTPAQGLGEQIRQ